MSMTEYYFDAFDGVAGAAYNKACPDGVLRPFQFDAYPSIGKMVFCVIRLESGDMAVGHSLIGDDGLEAAQKEAKNHALASL